MGILIENLFFGFCHKPKARLSMSLSVATPQGLFTITGEHMSAIITDNQSVTARIQPMDAKGNPATVDGPPRWSVADETLATVVPAEDGLSAVVTPVGPLGTTQLMVEADADLGEGITSIQGVTDITIVGGQATSLNIAFDPPTDL